MGRDYLVMVIEAGLMGPLEIEGATYRGIMPPQGPALKNEDVAAVLNYVLTSFNQNTLPNDWQAFTSAEVARISSRYPNTTMQTMQLLRNAAFLDSQ